MPRGRKKVISDDIIIPDDELVIPSEVSATDDVEIEFVPKVSFLTTEFGREDLNQMRDKINEIIGKI